MGASSTASSRRTTRRGLVLVGMMLSMALVAMDSTIVGTAIPSIVTKLGGFRLFPWVFSVYTLVQAVTIPIYGKLADLYGRKPVLLIGIGIFLLGSILSGLSWNMTALIAFRAIQGIGAGAVQPIATTVIGDLYTADERGRAQGYLSSVWGIAAILGPAIGGLLVQYASWEWIFYINVPIGAAALWMISRNLFEQLSRQRHAIDIAGSLLLVAAFGLLLTALLQGGVAWSWGSLPSIACFLCGSLLLGAFIWVEHRAKEPILPLWVFQQRLLIGANAASLVVGALTIGLSSFLPTFLQGGLHATPLVAGFCLATMSIGWPLASTFSAALYKRIGYRQTAFLGLGFCLISGLLFLQLNLSSPIWNAALFSFVMGLGLGWSTTPVLVAIQSAVVWQQRGVATGSNLFTRMIGSAVGAAVYGSLLNGAFAHWLQQAPATVARQLPASTNASDLVLSHALQNLPTNVVHYIQQGFYIGTHHLFWAITFSAVVGLVALTIMPRHSKTATAAPTTSDH